MKNYFSILVCLLLSTLTFTACSDDDDEGGGDGGSSNSSFTVDGVKCPISDASCSFGKSYTVESVSIPAQANFSIEYEYEGDPYYRFEFTIYGLSSIANVDLNKNYVADGSVEVGDFRYLTSIEFNSFSDEGGKLSIVEKGSDYVVVSFEKFSFVKDNGRNETKHVINGKVKFYDINAD